MIDPFQNNSAKEAEHPSREMLLLFVDGELLTKEAAQLQLHLEACWPCRVKTKRLQEAIAEIIEFDEQVLTPRLVPPGGWRNFDRQLGKLIDTSGRQSLRSKLSGSLGRFFPVARLTEARRVVSMSSVRLAALPLVVLVALLLILPFKPERAVSASELLSNTISAHAQLLHATRDPVTHQRFKVLRKDQASVRAESVSWEIWNDIKNLRVRHFVSNGNKSVPVTFAPSPTSRLTGEDSGGDVISELARVLAVNHMDPQQPLSGASYQTWHNTLQQPRDEVTKFQMVSGVEVLKLHTLPFTGSSVDQITDAIFIVRAKDWRPMQLTLHVKAEAGNRVFDLTQDFSEVVSLAQVDAAIFGGEPLAATAAVMPSSSPTAVAAKLNPAPLPMTEPPGLVATAGLEVEVSYLLNQVKANLGEQVILTRTVQGQLLVQGIVETDSRKATILSALAPVAGNPLVKIEVQTLAEAVRRQKQRPSTSTLAGSMTVTEGASLPIEPQLRRYLAARGVPSEGMDEEIRRFSNRVIARSRQAMRHAFALKRLAEQFSESEVGTLGDDARTKRMSMFAEHAEKFERETHSLRGDLEGVFASSPAPSFGVGDGIEISSEADLIRAARRLFESASSYEKAIAGAFAISTGSSTTSSLGQPQFWQSMRSAERLAALIKKAKLSNLP